MFSQKTLLNCRGRLLDLSSPKIMGILNVTPDSFYDGGKLDSDSAFLSMAEKMLNDGAAVLDVGGMSSRPGAKEISAEEELQRVIPALLLLQKNFPETLVSIDTSRSRVAQQAVQAGASIVNDISAGRSDDQLLATVARLRVPYVLMHMSGTPSTMQQNPQYENVVAEVYEFLKKKIIELIRLGISDIVIDPGFGFGKTAEHNFMLLKNLDLFQTLGQPLLAGLSRKSMIHRVLGLRPDEALNGTTVLNTVALMKGAALLRVHDVKEAKEAIALVGQLNG
jgi:dihydropteroate synthase